MSERCPVCSRLKAYTMDQVVAETHCPWTPEGCERARDGAELERLRSELAEARLENEAWRALAMRRALMHHGDDGYFLELYGRVATIESFPTAGEAAVATYRKHVLPKDPNT